MPTVKKEPIRLVDTPEAQETRPRLMEEYDVTPGEAVGSLIDAWLQTSKAVSDVRARINVQRLLQRGANKEEVKALEKEAQRIVKDELMPVEDRLEQQTWAIVDLLAQPDADKLRRNVANWVVLPRNLRLMLKKGLGEKGLDVSEVVEQAQAIQDKRDEWLVS